MTAYLEAMNAQLRPQGASTCLLTNVFTPDADLAVVFENRKMHVGDGGTTRGPQRRLEFMLGQSLAVHYLSINLTVVNDNLRFALHELFETFVPESRVTDDPV